MKNTINLFENANTNNRVGNSADSLQNSVKLGSESRSACNLERKEHERRYSIMVPKDKLTPKSKSLGIKNVKSVSNVKLD